MYTPEILPQTNEPPEYVARILFVGQNDWAGLAYSVAGAINDLIAAQCARVYVENAVPGFPHDGLSAEDAFAKAPRADWIVTTGDGNYDILMALRPHTKARIAVTHAGTAYRQWSYHFDKLDQQLGAKLRFIGADSLHLTTPDPTLRVHWGTVDPLLRPRPTFESGPKLRVTHSPASGMRRKVKGTSRILAVCEKLVAAGLIELVLLEGLPHQEAVRRRIHCDVHVDQMHREIGGFGQSAIEAMGAGCAVLADTRFVDANLVRQVGREPPPIIDVRDDRELEDWLVVMARDRELLWKKRVSCWEWATAFASPTAVARYWLRAMKQAPVD